MARNEKAIKVAEGTRIYNHGDRANPAHFGTITKVSPTRYGTMYTIQPDNGETRPAYTILAAMISPAFKGHGGTRIVTETAYLAWRKAQLKNSVAHQRQRAAN